jgi:mono/diheme cytochrome c family protein
MKRDRRSARALLPAALLLLAFGSAHAADPGAPLFAEHCATCHGASGDGVPGFGPPLAGPAAARFKAPGGREYLAQVVVYGISGVFELAGQRQFAAMTPQPKLTDDELAAVLNHVLHAFNGNDIAASDAVLPADIAAARRSTRTPSELHKAKAAFERAKP